MTETSNLARIFSKPLNQLGLVLAMMVVFTLVDKLMPHSDVFFEVSAGTWIVTTAMILCFVILNTVVALRVEPIIPYWRTSVFCFFGLLIIGYGWSYLLTGRHMDEVGSFRWLWMVLTLVYMVFFAIARSMKRIVDIAIKQDEKLRGED
jgi:hypothetical protein